MLKYHISVVDPSVGLREGLSVKNAGSLWYTVKDKG